MAFRVTLVCSLTCRPPQVSIALYHTFVDGVRDEVFQAALETVGITLREFQVRPSLSPLPMWAWAGLCSPRSRKFVVM